MTKDELYRELILDSELRGSLTSYSPDATPRRLPTSRALLKHWGPILVKLDKFDSIYELEMEFQENCCWSCGMESPMSLERAHICPRAWSGSDEPANIHLLCYMCHKYSEELIGKDYWEWFVSGYFSELRLDRMMQYILNSPSLMKRCRAQVPDFEIGLAEWKLRKSLTK